MQIHGMFEEIEQNQQTPKWDRPLPAAFWPVCRTQVLIALSPGHRSCTLNGNIWCRLMSIRTSIQLIGLREKLQDNPKFHGKINGVL